MYKTKAGKIYMYMLDQLAVYFLYLYCSRLINLQYILFLIYKNKFVTCQNEV